MGFVKRLAVKLYKIKPIVSKFGEFTTVYGGLDYNTLGNLKLIAISFQTVPLFAYNFTEPDILAGTPAGTVEL